MHCDYKYCELNFVTAINDKQLPVTKTQVLLFLKTYYSTFTFTADVAVKLQIFPTHTRCD